MNPSISKSLLRSLFISYLLSGILLLLLALALYRLNLPETQITPAVFVIYAVACFAGGFFAGKGIKSRRFFWGLASGILYFLVLCVVSYFSGEHTLPDTNRLLLTLGCCAIGGIFGGILS